MYSVLLLVLSRGVPTEQIPDVPIFEPQVLQFLLCSTDVFPDADLSQHLTSFLFGWIAPVDHPRQPLAIAPFGQSLRRTDSMYTYRYFTLYVHGTDELQAVLCKLRAEDLIS